MKCYTYRQPLEINYTGDISVLDEDKQVVAIVRRKYDHSLKRFFDRFLDDRYFVKYEVDSYSGEKRFEIKRMTRRGKLWFEGKDLQLNKKYMISYENWRIGIPELYISDGHLKIKLEKEMEDWSIFYYNDEIIARWKADFRDNEFFMTLEIEDESPVTNVEFFVGICQMTLFIGA